MEEVMAILVKGKLSFPGLKKKGPWSVKTAEGTTEDIKAELQRALSLVPLAQRKATREKIQKELANYRGKDIEVRVEESGEVSIAPLEVAAA
jgi:hypothetical protein